MFDRVEELFSMTIACYCGHVFQTRRSTACPQCGDPIFTRDRYETPAEFEARMAAHLRRETEIRGLPEIAHPRAVQPGPGLGEAARS
jgi:predicted  nucleic acid-binding Zn-ribbon protein